MRKIYLVFLAVIITAIIMAVGRNAVNKQIAEIEKQSKINENNMAETYRQSLSDTTKNSRQLVLTGLGFAESKKYSLSKVVLEKALEIDPNYRDALTAYGSVILKQCQEEKQCSKTDIAAAKDSLEKAATIDPLDANIKNYLEVIKKL